MVNRYVVKELRKLGDLASDAATLASLASSMAAAKGSAQGTELLEVAEGNGPVNALGKCLVKALLPLFPSLEYVELSDYKVCASMPCGFSELVAVACGLIPAVIGWWCIAARDCARLSQMTRAMRSCCMSCVC